MNWMVPERRLDEYQREVLRKCQSLTGKRKWIQGFAGSGKSVLIVHIVQRFITENPNLRICVAGYTHALKDLLKTGFAEQFLVSITVITHTNFLSGNKKEEYDVVAVDEIQDIPVEKIEKITTLTLLLIPHRV